MSGPIRVAAIIPARMASSRFPGKPLLSVHGVPMVEHVRRRAVLCGRFSDVAVATCDREIADVVAQNGGKFLMTSPSHPAATDRVAEAARQIDCTHVINVQGDEILVLPDDLRRFVSAIEARPELPAWNAVAKLGNPAELTDRSVVKCVVSRTDRVLFCAREFTLSKKGPDFGPLRRVLGVLGYRKDFLEHYLKLARTPWETAESIDQSRILEQDIPLQGVEFSKGYLGINEPREVDWVYDLIKEDLVQQVVLQDVLNQ